MFVTYDIFKGAGYENFGKLIFHKLADMVTFPTNISSMVKNLQIFISFVSNFEKTMFMLLIL